MRSASPTIFEPAKEQDAKNDRPSPGIFDPCRACRRAARSHHRRTGDADLSNHVLCVQRCRPCRLAVRAAGVRQHLYPHRQSDHRRAGRAHRGAGRRHRGAGGCLGTRGAGRGASAVIDAGRRIHRRAKTLWRLDQPVHACVQEFWLERRVGRSRRYRQFRARGNAAHQAIFIESIANPAGSITDIEAIAEVARKAGVPLIVDNTLATPYLIRPIDHGADIVVHSLTKFLGGHGNSLGGIIVDGGTFDWSKDNKYPMLNEPRPEYHGIRIQETFGNFAFAIACRVLGLRDLGPAISPFNAFMILTGIETLPLRMQKHCENAKAIAEFLAGHSAVASVNYAGLASDKYNKLARKYAPKGAGAVFTFSLRGGYDAGVNLVSNLKLFSHLANVGDTRSLVIHPASTTHSQLDDAAKVRSGAAPDVVRLSIGIEDKEDLIADLEQALGA